MTRDWPCCSRSLWLLATTDAARATVPESKAEQVLTRAVDTLHRLKMLTASVRFHREGESDVIAIDVAMTRDGRVRARASSRDGEVAGVLCSADSIIEWDWRRRQWTRYPASERPQLGGRLRLIGNGTDADPIVLPLSWFADSWLVSNGRGLDWLVQRLLNVPKLDAKEEIVAGRKCTTVSGSLRTPSGLFTAVETVRFSFDAASMLPAVFENSVTVESAVPFARATPNGYRFEFERVRRSTPPC
jgi:hypothetical protein